MNKIIKIILLSVGTISVALGILGIILPLLPTTPFLLLGAACYVRSSDKLYILLISNKILGSYIKNYREGKGINLKTKIISLTVLWVSIGYSTIFVVEQWVVRVMIIIIASLVTKHILSMKTLNEENVEVVSKEPELKEIEKSSTDIQAELKENEEQIEVKGKVVESYIVRR